MRCPNCGHDSPTDAVYCGQCRAALTRPCRTCGEPAPFTSATCPSCGAPLATSAHVPVRPPPAPPSPPSSQSAQSAQSPRSRARSAQSEGSDFTGVVRDLQQREERASNGVVTVVWTLRIERHDAGGNRLATVPVEMRGFSFSGALSNGDEVRLRGKWKRGTLHAETLDNLTTGAFVKVERHRVAQIISAIVFFLVCAFILSIPLGVMISSCGNGS